MFVDRGYNVAAVVRRPEAMPEGCRTVVCDLTEPESVGRLVAAVRPDYVLHLAGRNEVACSWREPAAYMEANAMATIYLLDALRNASACRIVVVGSMLRSRIDAPGTGASAHPYGLSKTIQAMTALSWANLFGQQVIVAEPVNLIGPGRSNGICGLLARKIVAAERGIDRTPFRLSSLDEAREFLDVRDAAAAYAVLLEKGTAAAGYSIGSGTIRTLGDVAKAFQRLTDQPLRLEIGTAAGSSLPYRPVDLAAMESFGWRPAIPFETSLADALAYYRNEASTM